MCFRTYVPSPRRTVKTGRPVLNSVDLTPKNRSCFRTNVPLVPSEELFGEAKECMGLRRAKFRRRRFIRGQVLMTATVQNIKRMVKLLSKGGYTERAEVAQRLGESFHSKRFSKLFGLMTLFRYRTQYFLQNC